MTTASAHNHSSVSMSPDTSTKFCLGDHEYSLRERVYAHYHDGFAYGWYAGYVVGIEPMSPDIEVDEDMKPPQETKLGFRVKWADGTPPEGRVVSPDQLVPASVVLRENTPISLSGRDEMELVVKNATLKQNHQWAINCFWKRGVVMPVDFKKTFISSEYEIIHNLFAIGQLKRWSNLIPRKRLENHCFVLSFSSGNEIERQSLEWKIQHLGGRVCKDIQELKEAETIPRRKMLLSAQPNRSVKYFGALLARIPCVSTNWLEEVVKNGPCGVWGVEVSKFLLDAGYSEALDQRFTQENRPYFLLDNMRIGMVGSEVFVGNWLQVLQHGRCRPVQLSESDVAGLKRAVFDIFVVDDSSPIPEWICSSLAKRAKDLRIPLVNEQWIIDAIISGRKPTVGNPAYSIPLVSDTPSPAQPEPSVPSVMSTAMPQGTRKKNSAAASGSGTPAKRVRTA